MREGLALVLVFLAIISVIALFSGDDPSAGAIIGPWQDLLTTLLGWGIAFAAPLLAGFAVMLWMKTMPAERWMAATGAAVVALAVLGMFHLAVGGGADAVATGEGGGALGFAVSGLLTGAVGSAGAWVVLVLLAVVGLLLYFNMTVGDLVAAYLAGRDERHEQEADAARRAAKRATTEGRGRGEASAEADGRPGIIDRMRDRLAGGGDVDDEPPVILRRERPAPSMNGAPRAAAPTAIADIAGDELEPGEEALLAEAGESAKADAALETVNRSWELPSLDLLADAPESSAAQMDLSAKGQRIRETLAHFGIGVKVARIQEGPVVTQYALDVADGIKLSRIEGLSDNLALALAARSIRIEAPIPGEPFVGVEIPNSAFDLVTLKEVLASRNFADASGKSKLAFALGQDVAGQPFSADLAKMPHLLIAGATGSGKSVCVNALIDSFLMNATPAEVKLILIDPKRVELAQYKGIPHLLTEVIVEPDKAVNALKWTVGTMEGRYAEFAARGVRNIGGYNEALRAGEPRMPYIVIVIDELADLMMVSAYEVEATVTRIAQLARATGIHLVVATQRPSVQVITGLIKANIPSRIAFAMTSGIDSRTILDANGAEDLLGRGDMLYQPIDAPRAVRLQGVLVTDPEIEAVAHHWRAQGGPQYRPEITAPKRDGKPGGRPGEGDEEDDADALLSQAVDIVRRSDKASASLLQRRLRIGYARAARILDQMEDRGIVGPADGSRFREVLVTSDGWGGDVAPDEEDPA
ncbi:MAG: DNA translocase FtsK 4TM domain-containing protein [Chloroflexi bacterium]|nr:DNA translocase FtsK 4TM domain-containing protein [Chloroflexota bacterium]MBA3739947.1 DNA translocase FtsK 4TM domain-containing protein [Chloroflexota bacterium]